MLNPELVRIAEYAKSQPGVTLIWKTAGLEKTDIILSAHHLSGLKAVKYPLDRLLAGDVLEENGKPLWDNFFACAAGQLLIARDRIDIGRHRYCVSLTILSPSSLIFWMSSLQRPPLPHCGSQARLGTRKARRVSRLSDCPGANSICAVSHLIGISNTFLR